MSTKQAGQPFEMAVERGKVREFARAVRMGVGLTLQMGDSRQPHSSRPRRSGTHGPVVHRRFPRGPRVLHAEQRFRLIDDPPAVGAELVGQTRIDRQYLKLNKRGLEIHFTDVVTTFTDVSGALVAEMTMVLVEQGGSRHE